MEEGGLVAYISDLFILGNIIFISLVFLMLRRVLGFLIF